MRLNVGTIDRIARIGTGSLILIAALALGGMAGALLGLGALSMLATGLAGWCPTYALFGLSTCGLHLPQRGKTAMR